MFKYNVFCLLLVFGIRSHARVAYSDEKLSDIITNNVISQDVLKVTKAVINLDLPTTESITTTDIATNKSDDISTHIVTVNDTLDNTILEPDKSKPYVPDDNGTALILTPFIEEGRVEDAREACKVNPDLFLGIESYSGFLTVNKTYNSNLFFWYFPFGEKVNETEWVLWLQGGPGASSMTGLFDEIGPFTVDFRGTLKKNPYTWHRNHSLVFIDNPVGTGFSFTDHSLGYTRDKATYSKHLYTALKQLIQIFPELRAAPLFIAGESYAGKYVPSLGMEIHRHKDTPGGDLNFQGLIVGNAYIDPEMISHLVRPFYNFGLLQREQVEVVRPLLDSFNQEIAANRSVAAKDKWNSLITVLLVLTHQKHVYNFLRDEISIGSYYSFLARSEVKRALHVGDIRFSIVNVTVNVELAPDFLSSTKAVFEELLDHYRVLAYCGQLDQMLPCAATSENYRTWKWSAAEEFIKATRYPYIFNHRLAGYRKSGGGLTEVVFRGAGHMVPLDAPAPTQTLVARWTHNQKLSVNYHTLEPGFIEQFVKNNSLVHFL